MGRIAVVILIFCLCFGLCGCDFWMEGSYAHVSPHEMPSQSAEGEQIKVNSYQSLYNALCKLVEGGVTTATIYYPQEHALTVQNYMESSVGQLCDVHPIGSYAVDTITYEVGTRGGLQAIAIEVTYVHSLSDVRNIKRVREITDGLLLVQEALNGCVPSATFFVEKYVQIDFAQMVKNYVDENPDVCMELPQVTVTTYPNEGESRVVEVRFDYENSRDDLRVMQQTVAAAFDSAMLYVTQDAKNTEKCEQLYRYLMLHYNPDTLNTSITPSYSLLQYNVGDSKAYATVYAAMCKKAGVDCTVVVGTKDGNPYYWNAIKEEEVYLFTDLLACVQYDDFCLNTKEQMENYVWDYSAFELEVNNESEETS